MKKWSIEEIEFLREKYPLESQKYLEKFFNRTWESIKTKANLLGIKRDKNLISTQRSEISLKQYGVKLNKDYFKKWSSNMAYILGFITADGCVKNNRLSFALNNKDIEILYKFSNEFGEGINVGFIGKKKNCYMAISSPIIIQDLKELGIEERKTFTVKPPLNIPLEYIKDYIRGYLDGDGCVCISKNRLRVDFRCNEYIGIFLKENINKLVNSKTNLVKTETKNGTIYSLQYWDNKAITLLDWIYSNENNKNLMYLGRKFDKYKNYMNCKLCKEKII